MSQAHKTFAVALIGASLAILTEPALAYIDPGTGSAILQGVLAALAAIALTAKLYWHRLLKLLGLRKDSDSTIHPEDHLDDASEDPHSSSRD